MKILEILKILTNKELVTDYLGYNETNAIIEKILNNPELINEVENINKSFWDDAKNNGILVYSDYTYITKSGNEENIVVKYQDFNNGKKHIPALVYQTQKNIPKNSYIKYKKNIENRIK